MEETRYQYSVHTFRLVNPSKKFMSFYYYSIQSIDELRYYLENNSIVKLGEEYYMYKGDKSFTSVVKTESRIELKKGNKLIDSIKYQ